MAVTAKAKKRRLWVAGKRPQNTVFFIEQEEPSTPCARVRGNESSSERRVEPEAVLKGGRRRSPLHFL
jgi:hypothetical protein